jgi:hypothetical protein
MEVDVADVVDDESVLFLPAMPFLVILLHLLIDCVSTYK